MGEGRYKGKRLAPVEETESREKNRESGLTAPEKQEAGRRLAQAEEKKGFWANYGYLIVTAAVVILVFRVLLQLAYVPSASMESTIPTHSLLISWQLPYLLADPTPQRGDVVTFWSDELNKLLVKRVIGLPGDEITLEGGSVYVNGERLEEAYLDRQGITAANRWENIRVEDGCLLVMGDNRTGSFDSRSWEEPCVPCGNVRARVMVCIPVSYWRISSEWNWEGIPLLRLWESHWIG